MTEQKKKYSDKHMILADKFEKEFIEPYLKQYESTHSLVAVSYLLDALRFDGYCPSVVTTGIKDESEYEDMKSIRHILEKVTLAEHSFEVARQMRKLLQESGQYPYLAPQCVFLSLAHDIGKIPAIRGEGITTYNSADHPVIAAGLIKDLFGKHGISFYKQAIDAILGHHRRTDDRLTNLLQQADRLAREKEVKHFADPIPWDEWFNPSELIERLKRHINYMVKGNECSAFTYKSILYVDPEFLYALARRYAQEKHILDTSLALRSKKSVAMKRIVDALRTMGAVAPELPKDWYARTYRLAFLGAEMKRFLTPLKIEIIGDLPSSVEGRKTGWLETISSITSVDRKDEAEDSLFR